MKRRDILWILTLAPFVARCSGSDTYHEGKTLDLITTKLYDEAYRPLNSTQGEGRSTEVARQLLPYSLQEAVDRGIIPWDLKGYTLPLGIWSRSGTIDFVIGMEDMWNEKKGMNKSGEHGRRLRQKRDDFIKLMNEGRTTTTLQEYREVMAAGCSTMRTLLEYKGKKYGPRKLALLKTVVGNFNENCFLAYTLQELLTPSYRGNEVNPLFKVYFFDRLLREAGLELIEGYPAREDHHLSFGPFQLTSLAVEDIQKYDIYLKEDGMVPKTLDGFKDLYDHVKTAALFAYTNWERLADDLIRAEDETDIPSCSLLTTTLPSYDQTTRSALVAAMSGCMHHLPRLSRETWSNRAREGGFPTQLADARDALQSHPQLQRYFDGTVKAYLMLEQFNSLYAQFG